MDADPIELTAFVPGKHFGRYEVLCELARGGMGVVAVGRLQGVHGVRRLVALKIIHPHLTADEQYSRMFVREAEIASQVHHGNVVPVLELGQEGAQYFLVMEYFPSMSLLHLMREAGRRQVLIPYEFSAAVVADACAGLHAAHELRDARGDLLGVVHRDATPSNLLLGEDGAVKVTDFGVARAASALVEQLTGESGIAKGKLAYLSPEQVHGEATDRRSDLFTLGVVLYELLGRRALFRGENELALARAIVDARIPDVREANPDVPDVLAAIVSCALERDRTRRFQTAAEMQEALLDALHTLPVVSRGAFVRQLLGDEFTSRREEIATAEAVLGISRSAVSSSPPSGRVSIPSSVRSDAPFSRSAESAETRPSTPTTLAASQSAPPAVTRSLPPPPPPAANRSAPPTAASVSAPPASPVVSEGVASVPPESVRHATPTSVTTIIATPRAEERRRWVAPVALVAAIALAGAGAVALSGTHAPPVNATHARSEARAIEPQAPPVVSVPPVVTPPPPPPIEANETVDAGEAPRHVARAITHPSRGASDAGARGARNDHGAENTATGASTTPAVANPPSANEPHPATPANGQTTTPTAPTGRPRLEM